MTPLTNSTSEGVSGHLSHITTFEGVRWHLSHITTSEGVRWHLSHITTFEGVRWHLSHITTFEGVITTFEGVRRHLSFFIIDLLKLHLRPKHFKPITESYSTRHILSRNRMSGWFLFNGKQAICQLYHGE